MSDDACITYQDVLELIEFDGETKEDGCADWYYDLRICPSGIYLSTPPYGVYLTPEERAALPHHPTGDYSQPILEFPCTLGGLQNLSEDQGVADCIDPGTLDRWIFRTGNTPSTKPAAPELASDASLGAACRAQLTSFAKGNQAKREAREPEWARWRAKADEIRAARRRPASKRELAELVKKDLGLPDSDETIRKKL